MANCVDPEQTAPIGAVCSGSTLLASILNLSLMLVNYLQQMTSADDIFRCFFFFGTLRDKLPTMHILADKSPDQATSIAPHFLLNGFFRTLQLLSRKDMDTCP